MSSEIAPQAHKVGGMTCGGCASSVTKAIQALDGSAEIDVQVDLEQNQVTVAGIDDDQAIAGAVEAAGFDYLGRV